MTAGSRTGLQRAARRRWLQGDAPRRHDRLGGATETPRPGLFLSPSNRGSPAARLGTGLTKYLNIHTHTYTVCVCVCIYTVYTYTKTSHVIHFYMLCVQIVSDARRCSDLRWFQTEYPSQTRCVRVQASEETRGGRGWHFTAGEVTVY